MFQSTPPVAGRRCLRSFKIDAASRRFNPRLPLPGGDAVCQTFASCLPASFNPRLPLPGGDASGDRPSFCRSVVSIHASRCREAMQARSFDAFVRRLFQSTPPVAGRRCRSLAPTIRTATTFQSTPPVAGRRCPSNTASRLAAVVVSIHASRCREAMRAICIYQAIGYGFQSTPPVAGRRCRGPGLVTRIARLFQSTPPVAGRRCISDADRKYAAGCFNPRLPLPGGDAFGLQFLALRQRQFQSTPPVAGRRCARACGGYRRCLVSIHASRCREAMRRQLVGQARRPGCFNPRLPLPGGDAPLPALRGTN